MIERLKNRSGSNIESMAEHLSSEFWRQRYLNKQVGWDLGSVSPPIKGYIDQLKDRDLQILIPGCGSAYEGSYLLEKGFRNFHLLDFAPEAFERFRSVHPDFPSDQIHCGDFFMHQGTYDLIIEQTLFCAIDPMRREEYAKKCASLLKKGGKIVGLLFDREFEGGPPYGGNKEDYKALFRKYLSKVEITPCYNSIQPRSGAEVFIKLTK